jgi:DNA-binding transcriptional LysR family regulator
LATAYSNWFIRSRLKIRQLVLLVSLDDERNIHRAAEALGMTQPGASKQLKELEDMLGVALFERLPRGIRPTWYGEIMTRHARMVLSSLGQAHEEILALKSGLTGQVNLGVILGPSTTLVPRTIIRMKQSFPDVQVHVVIETSDVLHQRLRQGALDMLVARLSERHDKSRLRYQPLTREAVSLVVRVDHPLRQRVPAPVLRDLMPLAWILPLSGSVLRHRFDMMCRQAGLEPPGNTIETVALPMITSLLQQSDMIALIPAEIARHYAQYGMLAVLPVVADCEMDAFGIITRQDAPLSPSAGTMLKLLREEAAALYGLQAVPEGARS